MGLSLRFPPGAIAPAGLHGSARHLQQESSPKRTPDLAAVLARPAMGPGPSDTTASGHVLLGLGLPGDALGEEVRGMDACQSRQEGWQRIKVAGEQLTGSWVEQAS